MSKLILTEDSPWESGSCCKRIWAKDIHPTISFSNNTQQTGEPPTVKINILIFTHATSLEETSRVPLGSGDAPMVADDHADPWKNIELIKNLIALIGLWTTGPKVQLKS